MHREFVSISDAESLNQITDSYRDTKSTWQAKYLTKRRIASLKFPAKQGRANKFSTTNIRRSPHSLCPNLRRGSQTETGVTERSYTIINAEICRAGPIVVAIQLIDEETERRSQDAFVENDSGERYNEDEINQITLI